MTQSNVAFVRPHFYVSLAVGLISMGCLARTLIVLAVLGVIGAVSAKPLKEKWEERKRPNFKTEKVTRGKVESYVLATGKIKPVETIKIGSFVSGPIQNMPIEIDFNKHVDEDDLLCQVDPTLFEAAAASAQASLKIREGDVERTRAQLQLAINNEQRAIQLREKKRDFVAQSEMDQLTFSRMQLEASLVVAEASVDQAKAQLVQAETNLGYTDIKAPKSGIIIDRKIEPGQTLAAQFQTPELFEIGVDLDKRVHIYASIDESDIGLIRKAKVDEQPVTFTVSAYRDEEFKGKVIQIRMSATETQNVVTYPVIVEAENFAAENEEPKLLPNMTADLSFKVEERQDVLRIPNRALLYLPKKELVRKEDHEILDGSAWSDDEDDGKGEDADESKGNTDKADGKREGRKSKKKDRNTKHVWVKDGEKLRAIEIQIGLTDEGEDGRTTEVLKGELKEGQEVVVGEEPKKMSFFGGGDDD